MTEQTDSERRKLTTGSTSLSGQSVVAEPIVSSVDFLREIFLRLPAKSLIRFKCVSKDWLCLISDPQFARNHSYRNCSSLISGMYYDPWPGREQIMPVLFHSDRSIPTLDFLDDVKEGCKFHIICSCSGLMLGECDDRMSYIVFNPTTQKYAVVPPYTGCTIFNGYTTSCLAFDPAKSPYFKVVLITYCEDEDEEEKDDDGSSREGDNVGGCSYKIDVYSSECASWKQISFIAPHGTPHKRKVFCNGAINWININDVYFRFDINTEKLTDTPFAPRPQILGDYRYIRYFGECGGNLLLIQIRKCYALGFRVLEMNEMNWDYCSWTVKYHVDLRPIVSSFPEVADGSPFAGSKILRYSVLSVVMGTNKKDCSLLLAIPGKIVSYNLESKKFKVLPGPAPNFRSLGFCHIAYGYAYPFIESLVPL